MLVLEKVIQQEKTFSYFLSENLSRTYKCNKPCENKTTYTHTQKWKTKHVCAFSWTYNYISSPKSLWLQSATSLIHKHAKCRSAYPKTPNSICPYFQIFDRIFCARSTNQSRQNIVKGQFFYQSACKNCVNSHLQLHRCTTLGRLYFVYICDSPSRWKTIEHFLQKQCTICAAFADADVSFLERLSSGWSSFPWFPDFFLLFIGFVQPLITDSFEFKPAMYRKKANFRKVSMQSRCSLV